jgi:dolichyldiphosphatase
MNDVLNNVVKNYVKHPRPRVFEGFQENGLRSGYGMPSAHAQFMGYFFTYLTLRLWLQWRGLSQLHKVVGTLSLGFISFAVTSARVYLWYHDIPQVLVGVCIGCAQGGTFFLLGSLSRAIGLVDWVLTWPIAKRLWIKDSCFYEPLSLEQEHTNWAKRRDQGAKGD